MNALELADEIEMQFPRGSHHREKIEQSAAALRNLVKVNADLLEAVSFAYSHLTSPMSVQMSKEQLAKLMLDAIKKATE